eukprot:1144809-Pelagomonas_calceolata.AAC.1
MQVHSFRQPPTPMPPPPTHTLSWHLTISASGLLFWRWLGRIRPGDCFNRLIHQLGVNTNHFGPVAADLQQQRKSMT